MQQILDQFLSYLQTDFNIWGLTVLFLSAAVEYVFPPFPGDAITLVGAIVTQSMGWHFTVVFGVVTTGSLVGAAADYWIGYWLGKKRAEHKPAPEEIAKKRFFTFITGEALEKLLVKFAKYGAVYIAINRFLPGIRAFFFIAAGMSRMPFWRVMFFAAISAIAWDALIIAAGYAIGANRDRLVAFLENYSAAAWAVMASIALVLVARWLYQRRKRKASTRPEVG